MDSTTIHETNKNYWNTYANEFFGVTALPQYGTLFITEDELHLFGDVSGLKMLEVGCGSGHSLKYHADRKAGELWGLDMSSTQIETARQYLKDNGYTANLICSPMENECGIPEDYFDIVYSIYAIGWSTDLEGTFKKIASYLKEGGTFIFSWRHPLHNCVKTDEANFIFKKSYYDESWEMEPMLGGSEALLCNRKISTYINALVKAGFIIEQMVEQTDEEIMKATGEISSRIKKAQMLPFSFVFKSRKQ